jgi:hypothetical protein
VCLHQHASFCKFIHINISFFSFLDWALDSSIHAPCFNLHPKFERPNDCDRIQFYRDRMLALRSWGVFIGYWCVSCVLNIYTCGGFYVKRIFSRFAHTPHLWERRVLFHVERRLHSEYQTMRSQNRVRNELNDVSVHTHYEAWLQHQWNMRAKSERRVDSVFVVNSNQPVDQSSSVSMLRRHNMYLYRTFADADLTNNDWYITLDCQLNERPLFIGIEDDLKHATPAAMQMHANKLSGLLQRHFPHQSPAELTPPSAQYLDSAPSCIKL